MQEEQNKRDSNNDESKSGPSIHKRLDFVSSEHEYLLHHVLLPRVLPVKYPENQEELERRLLLYIFESVESCSEWIPPATIRFFQTLQRTHDTPNPENISKQINHLQPGEMFAMFIRQQNTALLIHMPKEQSDTNEIKTVNVVTFPGNLHLEEFYNHPSEFMVTYPCQGLEVKFSKMMRSQEFSRQLCLFYDTSLKRDQKQNYVNTWLTTILSDCDTKIAEFPKIVKKVRDEAIGNSIKQQSHIDPNVIICNGDYFRRSSFYMAIKVLLQLSLTQELGVDRGRFTYKLIMLHFMGRYCDAFEDHSKFSILNIDLVRQFLAKIGRRIQKLTLMKSEHIEKNFYAKIVNKTKRTISNIRNRIDKHFERLHNDTPPMSPLTKLNFQPDLYQHVSNLRKYLEKRESSKGKRNIYHTKLIFKHFKRHYIRQKAAPARNFFDNCREEIERHLIITDYENWVLYKLDFNKIQLNCHRLWDCCIPYIQVPEDFHVGDPFGISKMMLVRLKFVAMIDRLATKAHPLLLEHRSGIDPAVFDVLLLPQLADMKMALELQNYFIQRNTNATYPSLIEQGKVCPSSFSVRFANQNVEMQRARQKMLEMGETKIEEKRHEWEKGRATVEKLRKKARTMSHDFCNFNVHGEKILKQDMLCELCELQKEINDVKVRQFEFPLPDCEFEQHAIVFESCVPTEISALKVALYYSSRLSPKRLQIVDGWVSNQELSDSYNNPSKLTMIHVDNDFNYFVVKKDCDSLYHACNVIDIEALKKLCTLISNPCSPYAVGTQSENFKTTFQKIQNELLVRQQNLPPTELKMFGSLLIENQLQKLYAMIEFEAMSFDHPALASILQAIWECGKWSQSNFDRPPPDEFLDPNFSYATIETLEKIIEQQQDNWACPMKLLLITLITVRIYELNSNQSVADRIVDLLNKIRSISVKWIEHIKQALHELDNCTQTAEQLLRQSLVTISITGAMTFFVNAKHPFFNRILKPNPSNGFSASRTWLQSIVTLNNNILLQSQALIESYSILRMLIRLVRYTGIHIEWKIREIISENPNDIFELIKEQWPSSAGSDFEQFYFDEKCPQVFVVFFKNLREIEEHVTIDLITGSILVNNVPAARLPDNITSNALFQHVFGGYIFQVQPDENNSFTSIQKYNGCNYEFGWINWKELIITEHGKDGFERELIPVDAIRGDFPEWMVEYYSHWWLKHENKNLIEFRSKAFDSKEFSEPNGIKYTLDINKCRLIENKTNRYMLDFQSQSYKRIVDHLARLEMRKYIHVWVQDDIATAELIRLNLKFTVASSEPNDEGSYNMMSNEFSGMKVVAQENCGTLYGLYHGLFLESDRNHKNLQSSTKLLLLPHGDIMTQHKESYPFTKVFIDLQNRRSPPFHIYKVDETMRQLKPCKHSFSAWFFLAHLHAFTSHGEIEPLTGMSGTERALQILQSNAVRSTEPYDTDSILSLTRIAEQSPNRELRGNSQSIEWPFPWNISEHCALDSFPFIVRKLLNDRQRFVFSSSYFNDETDEMKRRKYSELYRRDYLRCLQLQPNLRVDDTFIDHGELKTVLPEIPSICYSANTRLISSLYHANGFVAPENFDLKKFLTNAKEVDGLKHVQSISHILDHNVHINFTNMWLSLYEGVRKEKLNREQFGLILSLLSHENPDDEQFKAILALQAIASNLDQFKDPPSLDSYEIGEGTFGTEKVFKLLRSCFSEPEDSTVDRKWTDSEHENYKEKVQNEFEGLTEFVASHWPCDSIDLRSCELAKFSHISINEANSKLNTKLRIWNNNRKLYNFIENVEAKLRELRSSIMIRPRELNLSQTQTLKSPAKYEIYFEALLLPNIDNFKEIFDEASKIWLEGENSNRSAEEWWSIYKQIIYFEENKHLVDGGLCPRMAPSLVLPQVASEKSNPKMKEVIGALAIAIAYEQRKCRINALQNEPQFKLNMDLESDKCNDSYLNWKPSEYPEWLLFEIEQNLAIQPDQIKVVKQVIDSIKTNSPAVELNMEEGSVDIIVTMLAPFVTNENQVFQVIVSEALFTEKFNSLRESLGGIMKKRIFTLKCCENVLSIVNIFEECKKEKGVILTTPKYRLSSQLENYKSIHKDDDSSAQYLSTIYGWMNAHFRTILKGSDAILELIYPVESPYNS